MRAITTDLEVIVGRLGPLVSKALEGAIRSAMSAGHGEVTSDHLLRSLLDLPDGDLCVAMTAAGIERKELVARLDWHLGRLPGNHAGKPRLSQPLCLLLEDAGRLTGDRVRSGHLAAALFAAPELSAADMARTLHALPKRAPHLLASPVEDRGEVGRVLPPVAAAPAPAPAPPAAPKPIETKPAPAPPAAPAALAGQSPANAAELRALFADRLVAEDQRGLTLTARVGERETTLRLDWDVPGRVLVLRIVLPGEPLADAVRTAVALSTLNNAIPYGTFVMDGGRLAFRSHVFLDADGNVPLATVAFAVRICEEAAEAL
jgi:hypothetical protein